MYKKLILACMAIAAFAAFVVAPAASAANLTENGTTIGVGASITGLAGETKFTSGNNTVICSDVHMSGTVTVDKEGTIAAEIAAGNPNFTGTAVGTDCTSTGLGAVKPTMNSKLCLHIPNKTHLGTLTGCAGAPITFTLNITALGLLCRYEKAQLGIEITTAPVDAQVKVRDAEIFGGEAGNSVFCPGAIELDMEVTLTTTDSTTLLFSA